MSAPSNAAGSDFAGAVGQEDGDPYFQQVPSFGGPPLRQRALPARTQPARAGSAATSDPGKLPPALRISVLRRKWPALRALLLLAGLSAGAALGSARLVPLDWRLPAPARLIALLHPPVQGGAGDAPVDANRVQRQDEPPLQSHSASAGPPASASAPQEPPAVRVASPDLAAFALARGKELMRLGDVISARRFYELAATTGLPQAAFAIAQTYDPRYLQRLGSAGLQGDAAKAAYWYEAAARLAEQQRNAAR